MKTIPTLIVAGSLLAAMPLAQACEGKHCKGHHGQIMGEMDKNGDGAISKKEFDVFHSEHFKLMDANKDGKISKDEMEALRDKMVDKRKKTFEQHFDDADADHDGSLTKAEAEQMPMLSARFDENDANKDGKISKEELMGGMQKRHDKMMERREGMMK